MRLTVRKILDNILESKFSHDVLPTGFANLDTHLDGGFFSKELIILGAHTGIGKSQIAGQIFLNIASQGFKSAYFSLEISNEMIVSRLLGIKTNIKPTHLRYGTLEEPQEQAKQQAESELIGLGDLMNFYDDVYTLKDIIREITDNQYEFVVIDFIQNILEEGMDEYSRLSKAAITLQKVAKDTGTCILILSQLSNSAAKDGGKSKVIEYKGSGSIAMVADLGFFLDKGEEAGTELTLRKNRRGVSGLTLRLNYSFPGGLIYESD